MEKIVKPEMAEWEIAVRALAGTHENRRFLNDSKNHAKLLANLMIGRAQNDVMIFSGNLTEDCYHDALASGGGSVRILVEDDEGTDWVANLGRGDAIQLRKAVLPPTSNHFFVADNISYRYERDHKKATALANFNEPDTCAALKAKFDTAWNAVSVNVQ